MTYASQAAACTGGKSGRQFWEYHDGVEAKSSTAPGTVPARKLLDTSKCLYAQAH